MSHSSERMPSGEWNQHVWPTVIFCLLSLPIDIMQNQQLDDPIPHLIGKTYPRSLHQFWEAFVSMDVRYDHNDEFKDFSGGYSIIKKTRSPWDEQFILKMIETKSSQLEKLEFCVSTPTESWNFYHTNELSWSCSVPFHPTLLSQLILTLTFGIGIISILFIWMITTNSIPHCLLKYLVHQLCHLCHYQNGKWRSSFRMHGSHLPQLELGVLYRL